MENSYKLRIAKAASIAISTAAALLASTAAFASSGVTLTASVITGANNGLGDAASSITSTVNNQYLVEYALMFIGFSVVVGFLMYALKGHRKI